MKTDITIIGGGIAGLSLSIDLAQRGFEVVLIEKGTYPRNKVCGEYISMESHRYLTQLCPDLKTMDLPQIDNFKLSSTGDHEFRTRLDLGGFGLSRFVLEEMLYREAKRKGVTFLLSSKASDVSYNAANTIYETKTVAGPVFSNLVCNATGRKSNFETKDAGDSRTGTNYIGVKYHVRLERDPSLIEIHNFPGGYCGISSIEDGKSCLCYIVNSEQLRSSGNSIEELERRILFKNEHLRSIFTKAHFITKEPVTVSGINFRIKRTEEKDIFFLGDAAGSIAPITGNGMSIGMRSAFRLAQLIDEHLKNKITKQELRWNYDVFWRSEFSSRIKLSRYFQKLSEYPFLTNSIIRLFNSIPSLADRMIRQTHGLPF